MTKEEKSAAIAFAVKKVAGRVPVVAGCGCNNTAETVENAKTAQALGADALLIVTPYYNKCTQNGLIAHYSAVANSVDIPIIVYNVPGRTGVNILPRTALKLSEIKNIVAIKEAGGNIDQLQELVRLTEGLSRRRRAYIRGNGFGRKGSYFRRRQCRARAYAKHYGKRFSRRMGKSESSAA